MRLNLHLRGIDLLDVEFHLGSKGLYLDVNVFQPRTDDEPAAGTIEAADGGEFERAEGPVWGDDQPAVVRERQPFDFR